MSIERLQVSTKQGLPEGFSVEYSQDFGGDLIIREGGLLTGVGINGNELGAFKAVFRGSGVELFNAWKNSQTDELEGGE